MANAFDNDAACSPRPGRMPGRGEFAAFAAAAIAHIMLAIGWSADLSLFDPPSTRALQVVMSTPAVPAQPQPAIEQPQPVAAPQPQKPAPLKPAVRDEPAPQASAQPQQHASMDEGMPHSAAIDLPVSAPVVRDRPARVDTAYLQNPVPAYPSMSRRLGEEGRVVLQVRVGPDGAVLGVAVERSSGYPRLDDAASRAVAHWRFVPASVNGTAIESTVMVPVNFSLDS